MTTRFCRAAALTKPQGIFALTLNLKLPLAINPGFALNLKLSLAINQGSTHIFKLPLAINPGFVRNPIVSPPASFGLRIE